MAFLTDGYQTLIAFAAAAGITLREREVQPPDLEQGDIDTTTMRNAPLTPGSPTVNGLAFRSSAPKFLTTFGEVTAQCQYDPAIYTILNTVLGIPNNVTVRFPDASGIIIVAFLNKLTPNSHKEGEFPLMEVKIKPAMMTPVSGSVGRNPSMAGVTFIAAGTYAAGAPT